MCSRYWPKHHDEGDECADSCSCIGQKLNGNIVGEIRGHDARTHHRNNEKTCADAFGNEAP